MAFILQLTDGTDTIDFMTEAFHVEDGGLQISPPEEVQTWTEPSVEGGSRLVDSRRGNRTINITFHVSGSTRLLIRQRINQVNAILNKAILHSLGQGSERVTVRYAWDEVDVVDNFEVFSGKMILPDDMLSVEKVHAQWGNNFRLRGCELQLVVSPNAYGLSPSTDDLIELPLTNRNGTDVTGGLLTFGMTDHRAGFTYGGNYVDNYVEISGDDILGDSPAKVRIEILENSTASGCERVIIGAHQKHAGQMVFHWADPNMEFFTTGTVGNFSYGVGGTYWRSNPLQQSWTGRIFRIKLTNPEVYGSKKYRVFMSTGFFPLYYPSQAPMQISIDNEKGSKLVEGPIVEQYYAASARAMVQDLGVIQIPPYSPRMPDPQDVYLTLRMLGGSAYTYSMTVNHVWLVPVENGYRYMKIPNGFSNYVSNQPVLVDDGWEGLTYLKGNTGEGSVSSIQAMYAPVTLTPGKDHRIYFNFIGHFYTPEFTYQYLVRVYYSPSYTGAV